VKEKRPPLPGISGTVAAIFGAEILLFIVSLSAGVSLGVQGRPNMTLMALAGIFCIRALTSFPVVVGRGLGSGVKRFVCAAFVVIALVQAFVAIRDMTSLGDRFTEQELAIDKEIRDLEFELKYHDGEKSDREYVANEERFQAARKGRLEIKSHRALSLKITIAVVAGAFLLLVMNGVFLSEVSKLHKAMKSERKKGGVD
jgi:hypothetical protein